MAKYLLDNCCFCIDLRIGCLIIGYLNLIGSAIGCILCVMIVASGASIAGSSDDKHSSAGIVMLAVGIISLLVLGVLLAFSIVLLIGLHKNKPGHVKAFVIYCWVFLILSVVMLIVDISLGTMDGARIASRIFGLLISVYFIMVIRSQYHQMVKGGTPQYTS